MLSFVFVLFQRVLSLRKIIIISAMSPHNKTSVITIWLNQMFYWCTILAHFLADSYYSEVTTYTTLYKFIITYSWAIGGWVVAGVGALAAVAAAPVTVERLGFTRAGVAAGRAAARMMRLYGSPVLKRSTIAVL